jgi:hypothetical protein
MTQRWCAICGQPVLRTSAFLFEQDVLMHARCWPPLARLLEQGDEVRQNAMCERIASSTTRTARAARRTHFGTTPTLRANELDRETADPDRVAEKTRGQD